MSIKRYNPEPSVYYDGQTYIADYGLVEDDEGSVVKWADIEPKGDDVTSKGVKELKRLVAKLDISEDPSADDFIEVFNKCFQDKDEDHFPWHDGIYTLLTVYME